MVARHLRRGNAVVNQAAGKPAFSTRALRGDLLAQAIEKQGIPGLLLLLDLVEAEAGDLHVNARLRRLIDLDSDAFRAASARVHGAPR